VTHKPLKLNPSKDPQLPCPRVEQAPRHEEEIFEEGTAQPDQPQTGAQTVTGLTGAEHWSTSGEAGNMASLAGPPLLYGNSSTSYLGCAGASMTSKLSNKGLEGQISK
jgi:hypothetical protein